MKEKPRLSILIVDDNSRNLQILAEILSQSKYRVAMAKDGLKALNFVSKMKPDLVLLDVMMPGMDGFDVCRRMKSENSTKDIPVIFISALKDTSDKIRGFEAGGVDYIIKPFSKEEVLARVDVHLKLKKAREELKSTNMLLSSANAARDKLFAIIAHDLRGSIGSLGKMLEMMSNKNAAHDTVREAEFIRKLGTSAKRTCDLLENLLSWARSQRGEFDYYPQETDIAQIVDVTIGSLRSIAEEKSIRLYSLVPETLPVYADVDMTMLVVRNLVSNALKFTPENGEVKIRAVAKNDFVEVSVADTGVGIPGENIDKLFRIDEHYTTCGTKNERGTGLGLLLCMEFVQKNRGTLRVESRENEGSRFVFTLPAGPFNDLTMH